MSEITLNPFSKEDAQRFSSYDNRTTDKVIWVPVLPINTILQQYFNNCPTSISIGTEGFDLEIVTKLDWGTYQPEVLCIETLSYTEDKSGQKLSSIIDYMGDKSHLLYVDTCINSIVARKESWKKRR